jgi:hypothetical protein
LHVASVLVVEVVRRVGSFFGLLGLGLYVAFGRLVICRGRVLVAARLLVEFVGRRVVGLRFLGGFLLVLIELSKAVELFYSLGRNA